MRIGILTLPLHTNYGGILQAYALQTVLEQMGHNVIILDKSPFQHLPYWKMPFSYSKRILEKFILSPQKNIQIFSEHWHNKTYPIISQHTQKFIDNYIHRKEVNSLSKLKESDFDALIVGSDQVWRPRYFTFMHSNIKNAFLYFAKDWKNIKRIAYAPSFGTDIWEYTKTQTKICNSLLKKFDAISVRESSAISLCKKYLSSNAILVLDPTLLLNIENYNQLINVAQVKQNTNMLLQYILDEDETKTELINSIAQKMKLNIIRVNSKTENPTAKLEERIQPSVEQWLCGFQDADFVFTDSFHACVFSIIYNKPFIVYGNKERGYTRFISLLSLFGLENRLVTNKQQALKAINMPIDWKQVNQLRQEMQKNSISFLQSNLKFK